MVGLYSNRLYNSTTFKASISDKEIDSFRDAKQYFSDCYLMTTLETLGQTENGRKILKQQIHRDDKNPTTINCYFYKKNGEKEKYSIPTNTVLKGYEKVYDKQPNEINRHVLSIDEVEQCYRKHPRLLRTKVLLSYLEIQVLFLILYHQNLFH